MELQSQLHAQARELAEKHHALQMTSAVLREKVIMERELALEECLWLVHPCGVVGGTPPELPGRC